MLSGAPLDVSFRPDIEGLRGVAVGAVVLYHAFPSALPGGFLGVDIFFVVSGFVITRSLWHEMQTTGRVDLLQFWARRIRRIAPAAATVLLAMALVGFCFPDVGGRAYGRDIVSAALSYFNWRQVAHSVDYLAHDDGLNPVLHYWSLSIEEQFYLVWPVALMSLAFLMGRTAWLAAAVLLSVSLCAALYLAPINSPLAFFGTGTRAWQLLAGALVAMLGPAGGPVRGYAAWIGGVAVAGALIVNAGPSYNPALAVIPTLGTALLLSAGSGTLRTVLANTPLAYIGRLSFSLYLWHWPLLVLLPATAAGLSAALAGAFVLAAASYHFIERPARESPLLRQSLPLSYLLGALLVGSAVAAGSSLARYGYDERPVIYSDRCALSHDSVTYQDCAYGALSGHNTVVLFGDSFAGNWFNAVEEAARREDWRLLVRVKAACTPIEDPQQRIDGRLYRECAEWRHHVLRELKLKPPTLILVSGIRAGTPEGERSVLAHLAHIAPTLVLRSTPIMPMSPQKCLRMGLSCEWPRDGSMTSSGYPATLDADLPAGVRMIDLNDLVCPSQTCRAVLDGRPILLDDRHFTAAFSATFADDFASLLRTSEPILTGSTR
jgi:peptidoglycan/LPS O-acetylase OafA/YrhL